ncbi:heparan-alpha-glucosaminide N-acetyltransferase-like isoform X2 [Chenopodium quinoa]|uniref:heparan-alpha-glucosaminide N-acetyltransferase-like isoform X2 n=1 Tax=Chenopodium quinoa TaxID=63459 RepID=UPI000B76F430|nr:heparan-alpha-glucosaminide N-acetyltransferase-like isoform X2 [Chenopodium quinoa]
MAEERETQTPLLHYSPSSSTPEIQRYIEDCIIPSLPSEVTESEHHIVLSSSSSSVPLKNQRLVALDVFRGLTIALMILVDGAGGAFPSINHSPWFGVTIADFVMPFFLFIVGVSIGLVFKKVDNKSTATKKVIIRVIKLFLLGIFLQGGFFHGRKTLTYGVDVEKIRWLGVLQRISIGYLLASVSEIWLVNGLVVDTPFAFMRKYCIQWMVTVLLCIIYICLMYGLKVPSWEYEIHRANSALLPSNLQTVQCEVRGSLDPPCNSVGFIDRLLLGENHLYQRPVYQRAKECSVNSPDYGPLPANSPGWCLAPFDPEGILSSLMAAVTCFVGLHFGQIIAHFKDHWQRIFLWSVSAFSLLILGYVLLILGMPLSKPLYTVSYMCITAGASGVIFTIIFYLVDVKHIKKPVLLLQWMGMNALLIYALAACEIFSIALQGFYWGSPENNLVDGTVSFFQDLLSSKNWGTLAFVLLEILFWGLVAGLLHMKRIYVKL